MTNMYRRARFGHKGGGPHTPHRSLTLAVFLAAGGFAVPATAEAWGPGPGAPQPIAPEPSRTPESSASDAPAQDAPGYAVPQPAYPPPPGYAAPEQAYPPWPVYPPAYYGQAYPYGYGYPPAPPPAPPPGFHAHDGGYLRLQLGASWTELSASAFENKAEYPGSGGSLAIAVGHSITPALVLYVEGLIAGASEGEVNLNGQRVSGASYSTNVLGVGPGAAYYFEPNIFVAATLLLAKAQLTDGDGNVLVDSKPGVALEVLLGKEWWVSDNWACGISGQVILGKMKGKDTDPTLHEVPNWTTQSLSLLFSATYN